MNKKLATAKNFVKRNQKRIVITYLVVTTAGTVLMFRNTKHFNAFLEEHDLLETFYYLNEVD